MSKTSRKMGLLSPSIAGKFVTFSACFDTHGHYINLDAADAFLRHLNQFKPDFRIHGGDIFDVTAAMAKATPAEKATDIMEDIDAGLDFVRKMRPTHITLGNHDNRLFEKLGRYEACSEYKKACELSGDRRQRKTTATSPFEELAAMFLVDKIFGVFKQSNAKTWTYNMGSGFTPVKGGPTFAHGYFVGDGACKRMVQAYEGPVFFGHLHAFDMYTNPSRSHPSSRSVGSMCDNLKFDYQRRFTTALKHECGWVYGAINKQTGECYAVNAQKIGGVWFTPDIK